MGVLVGFSDRSAYWSKSFFHGSKSLRQAVPLLKECKVLPAHINPLLASGEIGSEADRDLTALIYSGLVRAEADGDFTQRPCRVARQYQKTDWSIHSLLEENLEWHDGEAYYR
jgi:hypothetical protein